MRITAAIVLLTLQVQVLARTPAPVPAPLMLPEASTEASRETAPVVSPDWAAESAAPRVSEQVIKEAVRDTIAEGGSSAPREGGDAFRTERAERFGRKFEEARIPGCLRPDALKHQPTFIFSGLLLLPFLAVAKIRGKCH